MAYMRLGDLLVSAGVITEDQLKLALSRQQELKMRLGEVLVETGIVTEQQLIDTLEVQLGIDFVDLTKITIPIEMAQVVPKNLAKKHRVVPINGNAGEIILAMADPLNFVAIEEVRSATRKRVTPRIATGVAVDRAISTLYGSEGAARAMEEMRYQNAGSTVSHDIEIQELETDAQSAPTIRLVNSIIERAVQDRASDIHMEPRQDKMVVRMRVDGMLRNVLTVPRDLQDTVISRLKVMSGMDIAERRIPQDGRSNVRVKGHDVDLRMSTIPTVHGEKFAIRLLDKTVRFLTPDDIGITGENRVLYDRLISNTNGMILIVGPTGSGKSSTMSTMVHALNREESNLISLEDPVEYDIDGINQVQINEKTGMTFASGLRAILRQDPDIIAIGEIRDGETAEIAMRSAMTGHLVLSTIHTTNVVSALDRLQDIGIEPYLIAGSLRGVISQRLVRCICPKCKEAYTPTPEEARQLSIPYSPDLTFYRGKGCPHCFHTGYYGRTGVFEILMLTGEQLRIIAERRPRAELLASMESAGFETMHNACCKMVQSGVTTAFEAVRTLNSTER